MLEGPCIEALSYFSPLNRAILQVKKSLPLSENTRRLSNLSIDSIYTSISVVHIVPTLGMNYSSEVLGQFCLFDCLESREATAALIDLSR